MDLVATAPTVYGIETASFLLAGITIRVATAPTVYGIETSDVTSSTSQIFTLQQHLPFTVLKRIGTETLPSIELVATAPTVYGIETEYLFSIHLDEEYRCNSAYCSRY